MYDSVSENESNLYCLLKVIHEAAGNKTKDTSLQITTTGQ